MGEKPIEGWKAVAAYIGRSVRKTRKEAWKTGADPLPVKIYLGQVIAWPSALDQWMDRHTHSLRFAARLRELRDTESTLETPENQESLETKDDDDPNGTQRGPG